MEKGRYTIDRDATEEVFSAHGGPLKWLEAEKEDRAPKKEAACYQTISSAVFKMIEQESIVLQEERGEILTAIDSGLHFGLHILAYNFMFPQGVVEKSYFKGALEHVAKNCQQYIDSPDTEEEVEDVENGTLDVQGAASKIGSYMHFVDTHIDEMCPQFDRQYGFRAGAMIAQDIFKIALDLADYAERDRAKKDFEELMSFNGMEL